MYGLVAAVLGRDVLAQLGTTVAHDPGDPLLTAAILHWNAHHLPLTEAWWQFPIFHPTRDTLAFSEHLLGVSVLATPLAWITGNPLAAYNLSLLLTFPLAALAMYALVYRLTASAAAAFLAGLAFGFAPYRMSTLPHIQMLTSFWAPLALLGLHAFLDAARADRPGSRSSQLARRGAASAQDPAVGAAPRGDRDAPHAGRPAPEGPGRRSRWAGFLRHDEPRTWPWWLALFGAAWAIQGAANSYALVFFSVLVGLWVTWFVLARRQWRALGLISVAAIAASVPLVTILAKYVEVHAQHGFERSLEEMRIYSADVAAVLCAPPALTFWGWIRVACRAEGELFPGVALFGLSIAAVWLTLRQRADAGRPTHDGPEGPPVPRQAGPAPPRHAARRSGRVFRTIRSALLAVALVYAAIVASVAIAGPWTLDLGMMQVSVSDIDKPFLVALVTAAAALLLTLAAHAGRPQSSTIAFYLFAAVVCWLLALGPTLTFMGEPSGRWAPFMLLQALPGMSGLRVPARFWLLTVMCLTVASGILLAGLLRGRRGRVAAPLVAVIAGALLADGWIARIPVAPVPPPPPAGAALAGQVVLQLPVEPFHDIAATWRAVTGGWRSVNGYSGYAPNYYEAVTLAVADRDDDLFPPFRGERDLHVVVDAGDAELTAMVARQPGATLTAEGAGLAQYRLPRLPAAAGAAPGARRRIARAYSACADDRAHLLADDDEETYWECLEYSASHHLTVELPDRPSIAALVYSVGRQSWNVPRALAIETSLDGETWSPAWSGRVLGAFIEGGLADPGPLRAVVRFPRRDAQFVRVRPIDPPPEFVWIVAEIGIRGP